MAQKTRTLGGNPIRFARDVTKYNGLPELSRTPDGQDILPVRFTTDVTQPEVLFTAGKRPIQVVRDVSGGVTQPETLFTAGKSPIMAVRFDNGVLPEVSRTPGGNPITVLQLVDAAGAPTTRDAD